MHGYCGHWRARIGAPPLRLGFSFADLVTKNSPRPMRWSPIPSGRLLSRSGPQYPYFHLKAKPSGATDRPEYLLSYEPLRLAKVPLKMLLE